MPWLRRITILLGALFVGATCVQAGTPFTAIAVQTTPGGVIQTRVMIAEKAVRNEYEQDGHKVIEIIHPDDNRRLLLFPREKVFVEQYAPAFPDRRVAGDNSPCEKMPGTLCRKLGDEVVNNIKTEKWEFTRVVKGRPEHSLHWIERERQLPVREFFPDGTAIDMFLLATETVNNREAEKWRMQVLGADGQRSQFLQWYDRELKLVIREEHPDGYVRELRDIKVGKHKAGLFDVPAGYTRQARPPQVLAPARP